jgi:parvulin-like peptidyl-prolyl isomerase
MRRPAVTAALVALVALIAAGMTGCTSTLGYAAIVNGTVITQASLNSDLAAFAKNPQYVSSVIQGQGGSGASFYGSSGVGSYNKTYVASLLQSLVQRTVIHEALTAKHALPTADDVKTANGEMSGVQYFSNFPKSYQKVLIDSQADVDAFVKLESATFSQQQITNFYNDNRSRYLTEACVRYILIADMANNQIDEAASKTTADQVEAQLAAGGDFAALAMKYSADTTTGAKGGDVGGSASDGCLSVSDLQQIDSSNPEFVQAVVNQQPNQVGQPILSGVGYLLVQVTSEMIQPLSSAVTTDIEQNLAGQVLNGLIQKSHIKVNPEFGSFDAQLDSSGSVIGVVAPVPPTFGTTTTSPAASGG